MIGSGKSTWAKQQNGIVSDFDEIGSKEKQIDFTLTELGQGKTVYHITCYPTSGEQSAFCNLDKKYVWMNTIMSQCRYNILARGRQRDFINFDETLASNEVINSKYKSSNIKFEVVNLFETNERW